MDTMTPDRARMDLMLTGMVFSKMLPKMSAEAVKLAPVLLVLDNPSEEDLMEYAGIGDTATLHKGLEELRALGYVRGDAP